MSTEFAVSLCTFNMSPVFITIFPASASRELPDGIGKFCPMFTFAFPEVLLSNFTSTVTELRTLFEIVNPIRIVVVAAVNTVISVFAATAPPAFVFNLNVFAIISPYPNASASAAASSPAIAVTSAVVGLLIDVNSFPRYIIYRVVPAAGGDVNVIVVLLVV